MTRFLVLFFALTLSRPSQAFLQLMDTGNLVDQGKYRLQGEGQLINSGPNQGLNLNGRFATGLTHDSEVQFEGGVGSVDYYLGGFYKWIPYPDTEEQPAIGGRAGLIFANFDGETQYGFNVTPMVSKELDTDHGYLTPYGGLQLSLLNNVENTQFSSQLVVGTNWEPNQWDFPTLHNFNLLVEYGVDLGNAFSYINFGANYSF